MEEETKSQNNNMMVMGGIVVLIAVLVAGFFFMSRKAGSSSAGKQPTSTVTMEAGSYYFKPNVINAKVGEKIKVVMTSKDMMHNFNIDEFSVAGPTTKAGTTSTVEFTASKKGTFEFYCSIGQHRKMGQVGKLIIE